MNEIVKICKKHGGLVKEKCFFYKTKIGNTYPRCYLCMKDRNKIFKENGYYRFYSKTEKGKNSKKSLTKKLKIRIFLKKKERNIIHFQKIGI